MSTKTQPNKDDQEVDLAELSKKIADFFAGISTKIFMGILFLKRNILWIAILFIAGGALGYYIDITKKIYDSKIIVRPNFGSTDYLYAKIDLISSKIKERDTVFLKEVVGIKEPKKLRSIQIAPITDVYKFVADNERNFELIKLLSEDGGIKKIVEEGLTSKNYPYHLIKITTLKQTKKENIVQPVLNYLNNSDYYNMMKKVWMKNVKVKMMENDTISAQINGLLNTFSAAANNSPKSDKLVYYNENTQLSEVIKTKQAIGTEQGKLRLELADFDKIVKDTSISLNIRNHKLINGNMKFVLPFLFVFLFILAGYFNAYYKRQMKKLNS